MKRYILTREQHAKLVEAMNIQYKAYGWRSAMDFGRAMYQAMVGGAK